MKVPLRAGGLLQQQAHEIVPRSNRAAGLSEFFGIFLRRLDEVLHILVRRVRFDRDHRGLQNQTDDRCQIFHGDVRFGGGQRISHPNAGKKTDGVRLALFFGEIGHGDGRAAAGLVDDLHALGDELFFLQQFGNRARQQIRAAARTGMNHGFDLFAGLELLAPGTTQR